MRKVCVVIGSRANYSSIKSAMQAIEEVRAAGGTVALVLSILDRGEGAADLYAAAGVPFKSLFRAEEFLHD